MRTCLGERPVDLLTPVGIIVRVLLVAAAAGAKLAQILDVSSEHIAVTPTYPVGLGKVFQIVNCLVKLAGIEFASSPSRFEFLEVSGNFVEVLSLMTVETGALSSLTEVAHYAAYRGLLVSSVSICSLLRVAIIIAVAVSIIRILPGCIVRVLPPGLCIRRYTQGQNAAAE